MNIFLKTSLFLVCLLSFAKPYQATMFIDAVSVPGITYTPDSSNIVLPITITIRRNNSPGGGAQNYFMVFNSTPVNTSSFDRYAALAGDPGETLTYSLLKTSGSTQALKDLGYLSNTNHYLSGNISRNQTSTLTIYVKIPGLQFKTAGSYTNAIDAKLYSTTWTNTPPGSTLEDTYNFSVTIVMDPYFNLSLSKSVINLLLSGPVGTPVSDTFSATYTTNIASTLQLRSLNGGKLTNAFSPDIPYTLLVNSVPVSLPVNIDVPIDSTAVRVENRSVNLTINQNQPQLYEAGSYSDTLTLKIIDTQ